MNEAPDIVNAIPQLDGDIPADRFMENAFWFPVLWGCVIALVLAAVIFLFVLRRRQKKTLEPDQEAIALDALAKLEQDLPPLRECSLRLSMILRRFLTGQTQDPALFETHEEFSQRVDALAKVPQECQYDTRFLLESLADLKYSGSTEQDPVRARTLIEQAKALVSRITLAQKKEAEARAMEKPAS